MSKFLKLVQENIPQSTAELDKITAGKRALQRALLSSNIIDEIGVKLKVTQNTNDMVFEFKDGSAVVLEVKDYRGAKEEETEDAVIRAGETIAANDPEKRKPVTQELNRYKKTVSSIEPKVADSIRKLNLSLAAIQKDIR